MSDMKCPICNKPMKQATYDCDKKDNDDTLYMSIMPCDCLCNFTASKAVWQELIRTRKALDCAINTLDTVYGLSEDNSNIETYIKCKRIEINGIIKGGKDE